MYSSNYFSQSYHKTIINFEQTKKNDNNEEAKKYTHILYTESCKMKKDMTITWLTHLKQLLSWSRQEFICKSS